MGNQLTAASMKIGWHYNWKNQPERLVYIGKLRSWHQFELVEKRGTGEVWCEVLDEDLHMLEATIKGQS
jgi:hypothetical protein